MKITAFMEKSSRLGTALSINAFFYLFLVIIPKNIPFKGLFPLQDSPNHPNWRAGGEAILD
jgi:hypothetical protein